MNVHISYKLRRTPDIDHEIQHWNRKNPEKAARISAGSGSFKGIARAELASHEGQLCRSTCDCRPVKWLYRNPGLPNAATAIKAAFDELLAQIGKHKELLRNSHRWRGRRAEKGRNAASVPFESTIAAIPPLTATQKTFALI